VAQGGTSTLAYLAAQAAKRAKTARALGVTPAPPQVAPPARPQPAKRPTADDDMLSQARKFLEGL